MRQIDKADRPFGHLVRVEETELLLVAEHLDWRLAHDREIQRRALARRIREHNLMRQSGLARARRSSDEVEGILRKAPIEHGIEAGRSRWQARNGNGVPLSHSSGSRRSTHISASERSAQISTSTDKLISSPIKAATSARKVATT